MPTSLHTSQNAFIEQYAAHPHYLAPTGTQLNALSWQTEAPLRMLLNNLNAEVAEDPEHLIVYGGTGQAARNPEAVRNIIKALLQLDENHSLLIQSGKPVGVLPTHPKPHVSFSPTATSFPIGPPGSTLTSSKKEG